MERVTYKLTFLTRNVKIIYGNQVQCHGRTSASLKIYFFVQTQYTVYVLRTHVCRTRVVSANSISVQTNFPKYM